MSLHSGVGFCGNFSSNHYMHFLVNHFTKYEWIYATKGQKAEEFINLINSIAKKHNISILLADQYPGINSKDLKNYLEKKVLTCIDHPESNGLNEPLNQIIVNCLRCKINNDHCLVKVKRGTRMC